jgi:hypothetical protein
MFSKIKNSLNQSVNSSDHSNEGERASEVVALVRKVSDKLIHELEIHPKSTLSEKCQKLASSSQSEVLFDLQEEGLNLWQDLIGRVVCVVKEESSLQEIPDFLLESCVAAMVLPEVSKVKSWDKRHIEKLIDSN